MEPTLDRAFIEYIHDVLVGLWMPFDEQVDPADHKDINLLESSLGRPFQTFGGDELYATIPAKAAALFHALVCNHCFRNGNKRTAVIAVDFFFAVHGRILAMTNEEVYEVASRTATANMDGRKPDDVVSALTQTFEENTVVVGDIDPSGDAAKAIGPDRVQRMLDRMNWYKDRVEKLVEHLRSNQNPATNQGTRSS